MRKSIFCLLLVFGLSFANSASNFVFTDCHAYACQELAEWERNYILSEQEANDIYEFYYEECMNN